MASAGYLVPGNSSILVQQALKQLVDPFSLYLYLKCGFDMWLYRQSSPAATTADCAAEGEKAWTTLSQTLNTTECQNAYLNENTVAVALFALIGGKGGGVWGGLASSGPSYTFADNLLWENPVQGGQYNSGLNTNRPPDAFAPYVDAYLQFFAEQTSGDMADPIFRDALNQFTALHTSLSVPWPAPASTNTNQIALQIPGLDVPDSVRNALQPDGTILIQVQSASDEWNLQLQALQFAGGTASSDAAALDASLLAQTSTSNLALLTTDPNLAFATLDPAIRDLMLAGSQKATGDATGLTATLKQTQDAINILGQIVGMANKQDGQIVTAVGKAVVNAVTAISNFSKTTSTLVTALGDAGNLVSSLALGMNVLGAFLSIANLFDQAPDPTMQFLQNIENAVTQLSNQVTQLATQMNARFDNVDHQLEKSYLAVQNGFNDVVSLLQGQAVQLNVTQQEIVGLANQLTRLSFELQSYLQSMEENDLTAVRDLVLNWRDRHVNATDILPFEGEPSFTNTESAFYTWTTSTAASEPQISAPGPVDPASLASQLTGPVAANINVLSSALTMAGLVSFGAAGQVLPNMNAWAMGADYYAQLQWEWLSQYANQISSDRLIAVAKVGADLLSALTQVAALHTSANKLVDAPAFSGVVADYTNAVSDLVTSLRSDAATFLEQWKLGQGLASGWTTPDMDPFGAPDQCSAWIPPSGLDVTTWFSAIPVLGAVDSPAPSITDAGIIAQALQRIPPTIQTYMYLNPTKPPAELTLRAVCGWTDEKINTGTIPVLEEGRRVPARISYTTALFQGAVEVLWNDVVVASWIYTNPEVCISAFWGPDTWRPAGRIYDSGPSYADLWNASMAGATDGGPDSSYAALEADLQTWIVSTIETLQADLCDANQQQMLAGGLLPLGNAVTGWKLLLDNLVQLALPSQFAVSDVLTALLRGPDSIFDATSIAAVLAARASQPQLGVNVFDQISTAATARVSAGYQGILSLLQALEAQGEWDFPVNVYNALLRLAAIGALRNLNRVPAPPNRSPGYAAPDSGWYLITDLESGLNLACDPAAGSNGTIVSSLPATGGDEQLWQFQLQPDRSYAIMNKMCGRCLEVSGDSLSVGALLDLYDYAGGANQRWFIVYDTPGAVRFIAAHSGLVAQATTGQAQQASWVGLDNQRMQFAKTSTVSSVIEQTVSVKRNEHGDLLAGRAPETLLTLRD